MVYSEESASEQFLAEAFQVFDLWRAEHDPDGIMDNLDAAVAYSKWAETNSIEKYLKAAKGSLPAI